VAKHRANRDVSLLSLRYTHTHANKNTNKKIRIKSLSHSSMGLNFASIKHNFGFENFSYEEIM